MHFAKMLLKNRKFMVWIGGCFLMRIVGMNLCTYVVRTMRLFSLKQDGLMMCI